VNWYQEIGTHVRTSSEHMRRKRDQSFYVEKGSAQSASRGEIAYTTDNEKAWRNFKIGFFWKIRPVFVLFSMHLEPSKIVLENTDSNFNFILNNGSFNNSYNSNF
jgi:hypothetical protein